MAKPNVPFPQHFPLKSLCCVPSILDVSDLAMDQYLLIPFLVGWTSIYQLFWCSPGVLLVWHTAICFRNRGPQTISDAPTSSTGWCRKQRPWCFLAEKSNACVTFETPETPAIFVDVKEQENWVYPCDSMRCIFYVDMIYHCHYIRMN